MAASASRPVGEIKGLRVVHLVVMAEMAEHLSLITDGLMVYGTPHLLPRGYTDGKWGAIQSKKTSIYEKRRSEKEDRSPSPPERANAVIPNGRLSAAMATG